VWGANLGTPTFTYFAATDVNFANPLPGAANRPGQVRCRWFIRGQRQLCSRSHCTGFAIYTPPPPVNPTISTALNRQGQRSAHRIVDKVTVTGSNPTGVVTFSLYNNAPPPARRFSPTLNH